MSCDGASLTPPARSSSFEILAGVEINSGRLDAARQIVGGLAPLDAAELASKHRMLATILKREGRLAAAIREASAGASSDPANPDHFLFLSRLCEEADLVRLTRLLRWSVLLLWVDLPGQFGILLTSVDLAQRPKRLRQYTRRLLSRNDKRGTQNPLPPLWIVQPATLHATHPLRALRSSRWPGPLLPLPVCGLRSWRLQRLPDELSHSKGPLHLPARSVEVRGRRRSTQEGSTGILLHSPCNAAGYGRGPLRPFLPTASRSPAHPGLARPVAAKRCFAELASRSRAPLSILPIPP